MYLADLHIHSRFSRATSKDCDLPHLDWWARQKGIQLIGTGDFTHPAWRDELKNQLVPAGEGIYTLRKDLRLSGGLEGETVYFVVTGEISSIYKRNGKTRKVHNLILLPDLEAADSLSAKLEAIGNIRSDGRPILGMDSEALLELTLDTCPDAEFIPAHIWTPHFSMFGAFSGFQTIEECFGNMSKEIHAVETGLSSDPPMNWRVSALDGLTLVSHSDAHSPSKLGREANVMDTALSYPALINAIRTGNGFQGTIEFFPEEGKYHLDGHRNCGVCLMPEDTIKYQGICPACGKKLTIGVEHRVEELSDRSRGFHPDTAKPFESLVPLPEVIAASTGNSVNSKKTQQQYEEILKQLGSEFQVLRQVPISDIQQAAGPCIAEGIRRLRAGEVERRAGFDGEYGTISLLTPSEIQQMSGQTSLFGVQTICNSAKQLKDRISGISETSKQEVMPIQEELNPEQQAAVCTQDSIVAVIAGPGTGKTKTLVSRIAYLVEDLGVKSGEITAVTFTNQAADEMRRRLEKRLGGKRAVSAMTIGTFHSICMKLLGEVRLISPEEALSAARQIIQAQDMKITPKEFLQAVSLIKNGIDVEESGLTQQCYIAYCSLLNEWNVLDFDDLLVRALECDVTGRRAFTHLLVDEFQDINGIQYALLQKWSENSKTLFVIGDPNQAIYGFRGSDSRCFGKLREARPGLKEIKLKNNYRSTPEILKAAVEIIQPHSNDFCSLVPCCPSGAEVRLVQTGDGFSEGIFIAKEIARMTGGVDMLEAQQLRSSGEQWAFSDIAVLCRTHRQLDLIEKCLQHDDIPCVISGRGEFLESHEVQGVVAFLQFLQDHRNTVVLETALRLLWNCPADLILKAEASCSQQEELDVSALRIQLDGYEFLYEWINRVQQWLPLVRKEKPWKLIELWEKEYGRTQNLDRLRNTAIFYENWNQFWNALSLGEEADIRRASGNRWESGAVRLMTFHASKGLEYPVVFAAGLNDGIVPLKSSRGTTDLEEERRLLYVGMTRAQKELILSCAKESSPFLKDLPANILKETTRGKRDSIAEQLSLFGN